MQYSIANYSHHALYYTPRTDLSYNCKFEPNDHLHPLPPPSHPSHASGNHQSVGFFKIPHILAYYFTFNEGSSPSFSANRTPLWKDSQANVCQCVLKMESRYVCVKYHRLNETSALSSVFPLIMSMFHFSK